MDLNNLKIKLMLDHNRIPFIPFVPANAIFLNNETRSLQEILESSATTDYVDAAIAALGTLQRLRGKVNTIADLPNDPVAGDTYIVGTDADAEEYMWIGERWERLGKMVDLSGYYTSDEVDTAFDNYDANIKQYISQKDNETLDSAKSYADAKFNSVPTYTAGTGIDITDNVISNTQTSAEWGNITGTLDNQTDLKNALDSKANSSDIPTKVSELTNDSNYATLADVAASTSFKGEWDKDTTYNVGDIVSYNASDMTIMFIATATTTGEIPDDSDIVDGTPWQTFNVAYYTNVYSTQGEYPLACYGDTNANTYFVKPANHPEYLPTINLGTGTINTRKLKIGGVETKTYTQDEKDKVAVLDTTGDGTSYLSDDGTYKTVKGGDALPVGTIFEYDGDEVPEGYVEAGFQDYSTEEQFSGRYWLDGSKIYKKTFVWTGSSQSGNLFANHGITPANVVDITGIFLRNDNQAINIGYNTTGVDVTANNIYMNTGSYTMTKMITTIFYVK